MANGPVKADPFAYIQHRDLMPLTVALWLSTSGSPNRLPCIRSDTPAVASGAVALGLSESPFLIALRDVLPDSRLRPVAALQDYPAYRGHRCTTRACVTTAIRATYFTVDDTIRVRATELCAGSDSIRVGVQTGYDRGSVGNRYSSQALATAVGSGAAEGGVALTLGVTVALCRAGGLHGDCLVSRRTEDVRGGCILYKVKGIVMYYDTEPAG